jgi:hypothetical protein
VLTDVKMVFKLEPTVETTPMMAIEMPAAIRPYSMAVAPLSSFANFAIKDIRALPCSVIVGNLQSGILRFRFRVRSTLAHLLPNPVNAYRDFCFIVR